MTATPARPVGRPSTRDQRRQELVDAAVQCILRDGVEGLSRRAVAAEAGLSPASVHYFVGTMDELIELAVADILTRVERRTGGEPDLESLFDGSIQQPDINQLVDELVAHSYRNPAARGALTELYGRFRAALTASIRAEAPTASAESVATVADGILALAHAGASFDHLELPEIRTRLRAAADLLVGTLGDARS